MCGPYGPPRSHRCSVPSSSSLAFDPLGGLRLSQSPPQASGIFRQSSKSISVQFHLPNRIPPPTQTLARTHVHSPFPGVRAGVGDAGAARGRRDGAGGGAGGQRVVGRRCGVAGAVMVGVGVPRGAVQPGGDAAVAGLRGVPGVAGAAELP